jgi:hypothetical protein
MWKVAGITCRAEKKIIKADCWKLKVVYRKQIESRLTCRGHE